MKTVLVDTSSILPSPPLDSLDRPLEPGSWPYQQMSKTTALGVAYHFQWRDVTTVNNSVVVRYRLKSKTSSKFSAWSAPYRVNRGMQYDIYFREPSLANNRTTWREWNYLTTVAGHKSGWLTSYIAGIDNIQYMVTICLPNKGIKITEGLLLKNIPQYINNPYILFVTGSLSTTMII